MGDFGQAIAAWKGIIPYVYPKPKAVEFAPEQVIQLARELEEVKRLNEGGRMGGDFGERLERAVAKLQFS
ncbi:hypothetical protein [Vannielia litorea]|uniref:hypothetical protein n=1 Tax=Vannielia litorea TaxID=1217970 RepID=UPI001BD18D18|nr:hypothetical protein [Vannielia litorea]